MLRETHFIEVPITIVACSGDACVASMRSIESTIDVGCADRDAGVAPTSKPAFL
jgi:hypothetical protein